MTEVEAVKIKSRINEALDRLKEARMISTVATNHDVSRMALHKAGATTSLPGTKVLLALAESGLSIDYILGLTDKKERE